MKALLIVFLISATLLALMAIGYVIFEIVRECKQDR